MGGYRAARFGGPAPRSFDVLVTRQPSTDPDAKRAKIGDLTIQVLMVEVEAFVPEKGAEKEEAKEAKNESPESAAPPWSTRRRRIARECNTGSRYLAVYDSWRSCAGAFPPLALHRSSGCLSTSRTLPSAGSGHTFAGRVAPRRRDLRFPVFSPATRRSRKGTRETKA